MTLTVLKEPEKRILAAVEAKRFIYGYFKKSNVYLIICDYLNFLFYLQAFESIYSIMATINFGFTTSEIAIVITVSGILALICQLFSLMQSSKNIGEMGLIQLTFLQVPFYCRDCLYKK